MIFGRFGFPERGIAGAATASLIAQGFVCIALISAMFAIDRKGEFGVWAGRRFNPDLFVILQVRSPQRFQVLLRDACMDGIPDVRRGD